MGPSTPTTDRLCCLAPRPELLACFMEGLGESKWSYGSEHPRVSTGSPKPPTHPAGLHTHDPSKPMLVGNSFPFSPLGKMITRGGHHLMLGALHHAHILGLISPPLFKSTSWRLKRKEKKSQAIVSRNPNHCAQREDSLPAWP